MIINFGVFAKKKTVKIKDDEESVYDTPGPIANL